MRSTQLVFLMLLLCSVQMRSEAALRLAANVAADHCIIADVDSPRQPAGIARTQPDSRHTQPALALFRRTPRMGNAPVDQATAVASHTGLLRA